MVVIMVVAAVVRTLFFVMAGGGAFASSTEADQLLRRHTTSRRNLIIHGTQAAEGRYPYFVLIEDYCGGALIAPDIVLAAGHCSNLDDKHQQHSLHAVVGAYDRRENHDDRTYKVVQQVRHPNFQRLSDDEFRHDFALFKLKNNRHPATSDQINSDYQSSSNVVVKLNRNPQIPAPNQPVTGMGMGDTDPDHESRSDILMQVPLQTIPNDICAQAQDFGEMRRNITYANRIHPSMICTTGGPHNERDACSYDSGSPIIVQGGSAETDILVALVSWGEECADPQFPGVNARVSDAYDWIRVNACLMSNFPPDDLCRPPPTSTPSTPPLKVSVVVKSWVSVLTGTIMLVVAAAAVYCCFRGRWTPPPFRKNEHYYYISDSDSSLDEGEALNDCRNLSKKDSYESIGFEVTTTS